MINITRSCPPPASLQVEKQKTYGTYRTEEVVERLKTDFFNKCYICGYKEPPTINIEHFVAHKGNLDLKFGWDNLFWACGHCNNTKLAKYDNILNCTDLAHDVENKIKYVLDPFPKAKAELIALENEPIVINTTCLLDEIYNGTTSIKIVESQNIRDVLLREILDFQKCLCKYYEDGYDEDYKLHLLAKIKQHLNKSSAFTAFKRWIIKRNTELRADFEQYCV